MFLVCKTLEDLEGGVAFSFLFCLCWKALVRMRKKRRAGGQLHQPSAGRMPLNAPWMAFFGVSTCGRTQLRMMRLGLVSGSNATLSAYYGKVQALFGQNQAKGCSGAFHSLQQQTGKILCSGPVESGKLCPGTRERGLLRVFQTVCSTLPCHLRILLCLSHTWCSEGIGAAHT